VKRARALRVPYVGSACSLEAAHRTVPSPSYQPNLRAPRLHKASAAIFCQCSESLRRDVPSLRDQKKSSCLRFPCASQSVFWEAAPHEWQDQLLILLVYSWGEFEPPTSHGIPVRPASNQLTLTSCKTGLGNAPPVCEAAGTRGKTLPWQERAALGEFGRSVGRPRSP